VSLGALIDAVIQEMQPRAAAQGVTIHLEGRETLGQVALHLPTLRRALHNLIQRAQEAMPKGGQIRLHGQRMTSHLSLAVQDTGPGIPTEHLPLVFTPLYSLSSSGNGLRLYVVHEVVRAHGGTVTVTSAPTTGTTFTILLPLAPSA